MPRARAELNLLAKGLAGMGRLIAAALSGNVQEVRVSTASLHEKNENGDTPLRVAATSGHVEVAKPRTGSARRRCITLAGTAIWT